MLIRCESDVYQSEHFMCFSVVGKELLGVLPYRLPALPNQTPHFDKVRLASYETNEKALDALAKLHEELRLGQKSWELR